MSLVTVADQEFCHHSHKISSNNSNYSRYNNNHNSNINVRR